MTESPLQIELRRRMIKAGYNQKGLARAAGLNETAVRDILKGRSRNPRSDTLEALGRVLGCTIDALRGNVPPEGPDALRKVRVIGSVQAGEWIEALEWPPSDWYVIDAPADDRFNGIQRFALEVKGASMNRVYAEGDIVICVRFDDIGRLPASGERIVVQRHNGQGMIEATVKEFVVDRSGQTWLWPRSSDPRFQDPIAIPTAPPSLDTPPPSAAGFGEPPVDEDQSIDIVALVIGSYRRE